MTIVQADLDSFFSPRSIAVVGASTERTDHGNEADISQFLEDVK